MPKLSLAERDAAAELLWKWAVRLTGLSAFFYVGLVRDFDVPSPAYVGIFGLIGLPSVIGWQKALRPTLPPPEAPPAPAEEDQG